MPEITRSESAVAKYVKTEGVPINIRIAIENLMKEEKLTMGFFSKTNADGSAITCALCNKPGGLNRYAIGKTASGKTLWKCPDCARKGGYLKIVGEKVYLCDKDGNIFDNENEEIRVKCDTCGHVYCYNQQDVSENQRNANAAVRSSTLAVMNSLGGTQIGTHANMAQADHAMDKIIDFNKCPKCNSRNIRKLSKEEFKREKAAHSSTTPAASAADELKKFKELLDMGVISQEEFDAKKKQLLGL